MIKLEKKYEIISLILMCNTVTIYLIVICYIILYIFFEENKKNHHKYLTVCV